MTDISHDSVNRFLQRENYQPKDMFDEAAQSLCLVGGTLSVDDTVLDKPCGGNLAVTRQVTLKLDTSVKAGIKNKQKTCGWDENYMMKVLGLINS